MTSPPVHVKVSDLARLLGWSKPTVHYWIRKIQHRIPIKWSLGILYVEEEDLEATLQALREERQAGLEARQAWNAEWTRRMALRRSQGTEEPDSITIKRVWGAEMRADTHQWEETDG